MKHTDASIGITNTDTNDALAAALENAQGELAAGRPAHALKLLEGRAPAANDPLCRTIMQLHAVSRVLLAEQQQRKQAWWELLSLDSTQATGHDIKQQFRKLALLVHPDRCTVVGASKAFVALQSAVDVLISQAAIEVQGDDAARATKRAKNADAAAADGTDEYGDFEYDVEASSFAWWTEWDDATCTTQRSKPRSYVESKTEALLKQEMEKKAADADAALLAAMDVETLRREVRARQEAMWAPPGGSSCKSEHEGQVGGEIPTLQQLKAAMLRARSALVGKLNASKTVSEEDAVGRAEQEGGFLR